MARIHITGASGAGVSTLGAALAAELGATQLDTDDFYWEATDPPYTRPRAIVARKSLLNAALAPTQDNWVLSGSLSGWGDYLIPQFDRVIFLVTPHAVRLQRLAARQTARFGEAIAQGGSMHRQHLDFLDWAARYDDESFSGRSRHLHERWLASLPCPVIRLDGERPTALLVADIRGTTDA